MTNDNLGQNNRSGDKKKRNFGESGVVGVAVEHVAKLPRSPDATPMRKSVTLEREFFKVPEWMNLKFPARKSVMSL